MAELTIREGDNDAARTGYWLVTGPQPEEEAYATVELSRIVSDDGSSRFAYRWYLHRRASNPYNSTASHMETVAYGEAPEREGAVAEVRVAWGEHIGMTVADDEQTAPVGRPWRN